MNTPGLTIPTTPSSTSADRPGQNAALRGASVAFSNQRTGNNATPKPPGSPGLNGANAAVRLRPNGALLAAASASRDSANSRSVSPSHTDRLQVGSRDPLSRQHTGSSTKDLGGRDYFGTTSPRTPSHLGSPGPHPPQYLPPPGSRPGTGPRSTSFIAATLAASRSASPSISPSHTGQSGSPILNEAAVRGRGRMDSPGRNSTTNLLASSPNLTDTAAIASTDSLISLFEAKGKTSPVRRGLSPVKKSKPRPLTPPRMSSPRQVEETPNRVVMPPAPPKPLSKQKTDSQRPSNSSEAARRAPTLADTVTIIPVQPHVDASSTLRRPNTAASESSNDSFVSASETQTPRPASPAASAFPEPHRLPSRATTPKPPNPPYRVPITPKPASLLPPVTSRDSAVAILPIDHLSDAIVAGSLASARHPPTRSKTPPPVPVPRRQHRSSHSSHVSHTSFGTSHSRSPPKRVSMPQTLRSPHSKSDDEDARRHRDRFKKPLVRGKHKHHEGARRRWREEITSRERRRYEAVWASNRGQLLDPSSSSSRLGGGDADESIPNVVIRDLWSRSRLPYDELAEVWDLVDRSRQGRLSKAEFVVGMWLIDQRLRGRKIPTRVSESVWNSAQGVRITEPGKGKKT